MENDLPRLLDQGASIVVSCDAVPVRMTGSWVGAWTVEVILPSGASRQLVTLRAPHTARVIKTLTGVASMLSLLGCELMSIPFVQGCSGTNRPQAVHRERP